MRLSFVIPTFNQAGFIRRCMDCCLAQGVQDAEIIVVDGQSTDGTQEILAGYGSKIRWVSEPDRGQSDALNKGVRMACGRIIAWINSDDYYPDPPVLPRVLAVFEDDPAVDVVYGDVQLVDHQGRPFRRCCSDPLQPLKRLLTQPGCRIFQPGVFFKRQLFLDVGGLNESLHYAMDYDLWLRLFPRAAKLVHLPRILACAVTHAQAKSRANLSASIRETWWIKRRYRAAFNLTWSDRLRLTYAWGKDHLYWLLHQLGLIRLP